MIYNTAVIHADFVAVIELFRWILARQYNMVLIFTFLNKRDF